MKKMVVNTFGEVYLGDDLVLETDEKIRLTTDEKAFMNAVHFRQAVNDSRFRVYGITNDDGHQVILVTEFIAFSDDTEAWKQIEEAAKNAACEINVMIEKEHLDKSKKEGDKEWTLGPNHGRMEKQVEVFCYVNGLDIKDIKNRIEKIKEHTKEIWPKYGVDVL
jgi:hypothetical protein